jgi:hypothetical protein
VEEAIEYIERHLTRSVLDFIWECINGGLSDYANAEFYSDAARRDHTPSVRSSIRNCHIVKRAQRAALETEDIKAHVKRSRVVFVVDGMVQIWFKKFTKGLRVRYIPTQQALDFVWQQPQRQPTLWPEGELPPSKINLIAGYLSDPVEAEFEVWLTYPKGNANIWTLKLSGADIAELSPGLPHVPDSASPGKPARRVQVRPSALISDKLEDLHG